jgi:hypothetical protein
MTPPCCLINRTFPNEVNQLPDEHRGGESKDGAGADDNADPALVNTTQYLCRDGHSPPKVIDHLFGHEPGTLRCEVESVELRNSVPGSQWQTTSRHLRQLEEAGLISVGLQGRERIYTLNHEYMLELLDRWADRFR